MSRFDANMPVNHPLSDDYGRHDLADLSDQGESGHDLWNVVDDRLRGRWKWAILLGVVLGTLLAAAGYLSATVKYESTGLIRVAPRLSPILRDTPETGVMPLYSSFVQTQAQLVSSQRVLQRALSPEVIAQLPWSTQQEAMREVRSNLRVRSGRDTELITVQFEHESPAVAQTVVDSVLNAYDDVYGSIDQDENQRKLEQLRARRSTLMERRSGHESEVRRVVSDGSEYAISDFSELLNRRVERIDEIRTQIRNLELMKAGSEAQEDQENDSELEGHEPSFADRDLEAFDSRLADLRRGYNERWRNYRRAQDRYRPNAPALRRAESELHSAERMYIERKEEVRGEYEELVARGEVTSGSLADTGGLPLPAIERQLERLYAELEEQQSEASRMASSQRRIEELNSEVEELDRSIAETRDRIHELEFETGSESRGRIQIAATADRPSGPSSDRRRALGVMGFLAGLGASMGLFFLIGSLDRRAYSAKQLRSSRQSQQLLGVLPNLRGYSGDLDSSSVAAHCVHQIRNFLEVVRPSKPEYAFAVSSPYQGDGKTSVVMALGASYATAGHRTVMIDCDLGGRSLTHYVGLTGQNGLKEVLREGRLNGQVVPLSVPNLSVLPVGADSQFGPESVRRKRLQMVIEELKKEFEIIIIDTGPMLGSIESLPVAACADGVIMTMRRGRARNRLDEAMQSMAMVGANCLGVVLNCASSSDCDHYVSQSSIPMPSDHSMNGHTGSDSVGVAAERDDANPLATALLATTRRGHDPE